MIRALPLFILVACATTPPLDDGGGGGGGKRSRVCFAIARGAFHVQHYSFQLASGEVLATCSWASQTDAGLFGVNMWSAGSAGAHKATCTIVAPVDGKPMSLAYMRREDGTTKIEVRAPNDDGSASTLLETWEVPECQ